MTQLYHLDAIPWNGQRINGVLPPGNAAQLWTDAELADIGLCRPQQPVTIPEGKQVSTTVELVGGVVRFALEDIPPEPWPELSQRQFWKVLALAGMHADVMTAVDSLPLEDQIEAKQALSYQHDHWLIQATRPAFGLDDVQFRDLWFWGASL